MNERIKELALEALTYVTHNPKANKLNSGDMFDEKFAELIVRECIDWCNAHARDDGTAQRIAEDIKKDFWNYSLLYCNKNDGMGFSSNEVGKKFNLITIKTKK